MFEQIGMEALITWVGTAGVIMGSGKVMLNGTKNAIHETRADVKKIVQKLTDTAEIVAVVDERSKTNSDSINRLESRLG